MLPDPAGPDPGEGFGGDGRGAYGDGVEVDGSRAVPVGENLHAGRWIDAEGVGVGVVVVVRSDPHGPSPMHSWLISVWSNLITKARKSLLPLRIPVVRVAQLRLHLETLVLMSSMRPMADEALPRIPESSQRNRPEEVALVLGRVVDDGAKLLNNINSSNSNRLSLQRRKSSQPEIYP